MTAAADTQMQSLFDASLSSNATLYHFTFLRVRGLLSLNTIPCVVPILI